MTYFTKKLKPDDDITNYLKAFQFKDYNVGIKGSSMLLHNKHFGDYDLYSFIGNYHKYTTHILKPHTVDELYSEFTKILNDVNQIKDSYFVEFKVGTKDGKHEIIHHEKDLTITKFKQLLKKYKPLDFIQIEYINYINNRFITMTSDYFFHKQPTPEKVLQDLKNAINETFKKGNYYKSLKRIFNIYQTRHENNTPYDENNVLYLVELFNSNIGKLVVKDANIKAIIKLRKNYPRNERIKELTKKNLIQLKINSKSSINDLENIENVLNTEINTEANETFFKLL